MATIATAGRREETLVRAIGTLGLAASIVNITIGGGIFRLPANVAGSLGPAAPVAYVVCALAMGLIALCFADAGSRVKVTGGPYAYIATAFGPFVGFVSGLLLWMLGTFASAAVGTIFAASVGVLVPALSGRAGNAVTLAAALTFWAAVNLQGVRSGARLNQIVTVAKLVPLLLLATAGLFFVDGRNLAWEVAPPAASVARTSLLLFFAFAGIEMAVVPGGEVRDPGRTVPRAIAVAMLCTTSLYILLQIVSQGILGDALEQATVSPLADAAAVALGGWARLLLLAGAAVSMFGNIGGMVLSLPRVLYAFGRDGYLPGAVARLDPRTHAPRTAIVIQCVVVYTLATSGTFERLAILANVSALALYLACALAAWRLRAAGASTVEGGGLRFPLAGLVPPLACVVIAWLLSQTSATEWLAFGGCVVVGALLYALTRARAAAA